MSENKTTSKVFQEVVAVTDDTDHFWLFVKSVLDKTPLEYVRIPTTAPVRKSWNRFKNAPHIILPWESSIRSGGAILEELLDVSPNFDVASRIIVITTNPTHEDVVYMNELGVRNIICLRYRDKEIYSSTQELKSYLTKARSINTKSEWWRKTLRMIDMLPENDSEAGKYDKIRTLLDERMAREGGPSARYYGALGTLLQKAGQFEQAHEAYAQALEINPNYFQVYNKAAKLYQRQKNYKEALRFMKKMRSWNRDNISRMCDMGDLYLECSDDAKAAHCFQNALDRDDYCSRALNGLSEIEFRKGNLDQARDMLKRSHQAYKIAHKLNLVGIELVRECQFAEALDHYIKAQYVIPQQNKGPMLFYNMGLCYSRWDKPNSARPFLNLALVKEPNYTKASRLLQQIDSETAADHKSATT